MFVGRDVDLVIALGQYNGVETVLVAAALGNNGSCDGILQYHLGILDVGLFVCIVGVLVSDIDYQGTCLVRYWRDIEIDKGAVTILAVDTQHASYRHVELHIFGRHHAQHHGGRIALVQSGHGSARQRRHPLGQ